MNRLSTLLLVMSLTAYGCSGAAYHRGAVSDPTINKMTVGQVQKEIRVGMSGAEVASLLGSPNIVSTDENRREVWIYDKFATDAAYSQDSGGITALILGGGAGADAGGAGVGSGTYSGSSGASSKTQRTLTVIIKFDEQKRVRDFAYHQSQF